MKLSRRSLAYGIARRHLQAHESRWTPAILVSGAVIAFVTAYLRRESGDIYVVFASMLIAAAYLSWLRRGMQEVYRDQQSQIEEERSKRNAEEAESERRL